MATSSSWRIKVPEIPADLGHLISPDCVPAAAATTTPSPKSSGERLPQSLDQAFVFPTSSAESVSSFSPERAEQPPVSPVSSDDSSSLCGKLIRPEEIVQEKLLGRGGFGTVSLGVYRERKVVCKHFHSHIDDEVVRETYERELKALELGLDHENVVLVLGASSLHGWQPGACLVMSYAGSVTLDSYLSDHRNQMTLQHMLFFICDVLEGLSYLHSRGVLHLDLKPANCVFCPKEQTVRLVDFGALHVVGESWGSRVEGTVAFRAPELFSSQTHAPSFPCDVYSLAVTMWCLDSRKFPFEGLPRECVVYSVVQSNLRPSVPEAAGDADATPCLGQYRDLYTKCWSADPSDRPKLEEVMGEIDGIMERLGFCDPRRGWYNPPPGVAAREEPNRNDLPKYQLFDLDSDPEETTDVRKDNYDRYIRMAASLREVRRMAVDPINMDLHSDPDRFDGVWSPGWC